jgi:glycosyltransferase A (GT-A) superfamily protein (DUF2064 family)
MAAVAQRVLASGANLLLGLSGFHPALFQAVPWRTDVVCAITRERLHTLGWSRSEQCPLADLDEHEDVDRLPPKIRGQLAIGHDPGSLATEGFTGSAQQHSGGDPGA